MNTGKGLPSMCEKIAILVATFNGEKYICAQIESLLNQTYSNIDIFVRDDGSTDSTVDIIKRYQKVDDRIHLEEGENYGACKCFSELLNKHSGYEYVMFCDQDDVWNKEKIYKSYCAMKVAEKEKGTNSPILVYCEKSVVNENLELMKHHKNSYEDELASLLRQCHIYGCTMMMNKALVENIKIPEYATLHDHWVALVAAMMGTIIKIEDELILYRQHRNNVTGGINKYSIMHKIRTWSKVNKSLSNNIRMVYRFCESNRDGRNREVQQYLDIIESNGIVRIIKAIRYGYRLDNCLATVRWLLVLSQIKINR